MPALAFPVSVPSNAATGTRRSEARWHCSLQRSASTTKSARSSRPPHITARVARAGKARLSVRGRAAGSASLPISLTTFVGRETELDEIVEFVRRYRLVTITGAGGAGKTQTALRVARAVAGDEVGPLVFVSLAPIGDPSLVLTAIAQALGVREEPNRPLGDALLALLQNKTLLLILDNCEHVLAQAAAASEMILRDSPTVRILATSREAMKVAGERAYRLPSLRSPEAATLFRDRAAAVDHRFAGGDASTAVLTRICRRLDGMPLAIELAAARVNVLSLDALAESLEHRFDVLIGGERTALPRQQTMRATIDWSYNLLSPGEQQLFERLSLFAGGATLATAEAVCADQHVPQGEIFGMLSSLVDKSLVSADLTSAEPRYRLLESFRSYAREKLAARGDHEIVVRRYAQTFVDLAEWIERVSGSEREEVWRPHVSAEIDNWRAVLEWGLAQRRDVRLGQRLVALLTELVLQDHLNLEGREWLRLARELVDERTPPGIAAGLSYAQASIAKYLGQDDVQLACATHAIELYRQVGDLLGLTRSQCYAGLALTFLGSIAEGEAMFREALAGARKLRRPRLEAYVLRLLGMSAADSGRFEAARDFLAEAARVYEELGSELGATITRDDLGEYEFRAGNPALAVQLATETLATFRRWGRTRMITDSLSRLTIYLIALERYDEAHAFARETLILALEDKRDFLIASALQHLAAVGAASQQNEAAAYLLGFVDHRLVSMGSRRDEPLTFEYDRTIAALGERMDSGSPAKPLAGGRSDERGRRGRDGTGDRTKLRT